MNIYSMIGATIVTFALIFYSIGILTEQKRKAITHVVLIFLTGGVLLDITATTFMIIGSKNTPFTLHGFIGYSALVAMLIDAILIWKTFLKKGLKCEPSHKLHLYSRFAYIWWIAAYITGSLLVALA